MKPQTDEERLIVDLSRAQQIAFEIGMLDTAKALASVINKAKSEAERQRHRPT